MAKKTREGRTIRGVCGVMRCACCKTSKRDVGKVATKKLTTVQRKASLSQEMNSDAQLLDPLASILPEDPQLDGSTVPTSAATNTHSVDPLAGVLAWLSGSDGDAQMSDVDVRAVNDPKGLQTQPETLTGRPQAISTGVHASPVGFRVSNLSMTAETVHVW